MLGIELILERIRYMLVKLNVPKCFKRAELQHIVLRAEEARKAAVFARQDVQTAEGQQHAESCSNTATSRFCSYRKSKKRKKFKFDFNAFKSLIKRCPFNCILKVFDPK